MSGHTLLGVNGDILPLLLHVGETVSGFSPDLMSKIWIIAAKHITKMYKARVREGIG